MTTPQKHIYKEVFNAYLTPGSLNFLAENGGDTKAVKALYSRKNKNKGNRTIFKKEGIHTPKDEEIKERPETEPFWPHNQVL